jgi:hypothetical protein
MTDKTPRHEPYTSVTLAHAVHTAGVTLAAGTSATIVAVFRFHVRAEVVIDGVARRLRLPIDTLSAPPA